MTNKHSKTFFGQSTGITLQSSSKKDDFIFLRCIKRNPNGVWEKPSKGEGKTIKISIEEMIMIHKVFRKEIPTWSTYHSYKDTSTQISFNWQKNGSEKIWINIGEYSKVLESPQIELFTLLLDHLIKEKIEFATISTYNQDSETTYPESYQNQQKNTKVESQKTDGEIPKINAASDKKKEKRTLKVVETIEPIRKVSTNENKVQKNQTEKGKGKSTSNRKKQSKLAQIEGIIKRETKKALLIELGHNKEVWFPKSTIKSEYSIEKEGTQNFRVDSWIIEKNISN
jgi:hypothetical protein